MLRSCLPAVLLIAMSVPATSQEDPNTIVANAAADFNKIFITHDASKLTDFYTEDAIILPPSSHALSGSSEIFHFWEQLLKSNWTKRAGEVVSAVPLSDRTILATVHWSAELTDGGGAITPYHGDAAQIYTKTDKGWKMKLASWNALK